MDRSKGPCASGGGFSVPVQSKAMIRGTRFERVTLTCYITSPCGRHTILSAPADTTISSLPPLGPPFTHSAPRFTWHIAPAGASLRRISPVARASCGPSPRVARTAAGGAIHWLVPIGDAAPLRLAQLWVRSPPGYRRLAGIVIACDPALLNTLARGRPPLAEALWIRQNVTMCQLRCLWAGDYRTHRYVNRLPSRSWRASWCGVGPASSRALGGRSASRKEVALRPRVSRRWSRAPPISERRFSVLEPMFFSRIISCRCAMGAHAGRSRTALTWAVVWRLGSEAWREVSGIVAWSCGVSVNTGRQGGIGRLRGTGGEGGAGDL